MYYVATQYSCFPAKTIVCKKGFIYQQQYKTVVQLREADLSPASVKPVKDELFIYKSNISPCIHINRKRDRENSLLYIFGILYN